MASRVEVSPETPEPTNPRDLPLQRLGRGLLLAFALVLPFELPLFRVASLQITTVELVLYAMLAVWLAGMADSLRRRGPRKFVAALRTDPLALAAAFFAAVLFLSALAAPSYRPAALKFALRSLSGILVFFAARSLVRPRDVPRVQIALVAGAMLSATTALVDRFVPASAALWGYFRETTFTTFGLIRASGVFAYPTIGAMYWEAAVPLLVVLPLVKVDRAARGQGAARSVFGVGLGSGLLVGAILASATRSGLAGTGVACIALLGLAWGSSLGTRRTAAAALAVTLALGVGVGLFGSLLGQRLLWWRDESWFRVQYEVGATPPSIRPREAFAVPMTLRNTGVLAWRRAGPDPVYVSYHWERPSGGSATHADFEGLRTELPADVLPGQGIEVFAHARGPSEPGSYRLSWDLVQENISWFSDRGNPPARVAIHVGDADDSAQWASGADPPEPVAGPPPPPRLELWRAAIALWRERPLLGIGPDNFRRRYEAVLTAPPGTPPYTDTRIHANNLYFETLADLGLIGLAALAWLGMALGGALYRHWRGGCVAGLGSAVAAGTFFVHGAFDYFLEFTPLLGLFWLLLGLSAASEPRPFGEPRGSRP